MHQRDLLDETVDFLMPSEKKQRGIQFHENYSTSIYLVSLILIIGLFIYWIFSNALSVMIAGFVLFLIGISSEIFLRRIYGFTGQDATKYYAVKMYENPSKTNMNQLHSWNKNPFDLSTEYYYPQLGKIVENAREREDSVDYVHREIPDELRLIERRENDSYQSLVDLEIEDLDLDPYYKNLIHEANYSYKFGAYTSVSVLLRKISEKLIVDILINKGLYTELTSEYGFEEIVSVFIDKVVAESFSDDVKSDLEESLDLWIREKGNKGAHKNEPFTKEEAEELMTHAKRTVQLLLFIRDESRS